MSFGNGANPLRWDCEKQGCFNKLKRPKIEMFAECLPGRIAFGDVDAITEINGNLLVLEWKNNDNIPTGQRLLHTRWTANGPATIFLVVGDAETMEVKRVCCVHRGNIGEWVTMDLEGLKGKIRKWADWARSHPAERMS